MVENKEVLVFEIMGCLAVLLIMWGANLFRVGGNPALAGLLAAVFAMAFVLAEAGAALGLDERSSLGAVALASVVSLLFYYALEGATLGTAVLPAGMMGALPFVFYEARAMALAKSG